MPIFLPLASCTTPTNLTDIFGRLGLVFGSGHAVPTVDTTCEAFGTGTDALLPFRYHSTDAPDTKTRARAVNRVYGALCPKGGS